MIALPSRTITDSILIYSSVPELTIGTVWAVDTTYSLGTQVGDGPAVYGSPQTIYESLQDGNTGNALSDTTWWKNLGVVYPEYSSGASCDTGGIVSNISTDVHLLYKSLIDGNTGNPLTDNTKWFLLGATNRWAMFDLNRNTKTEQPGEITVAFATGNRCNSIGLSGLVASEYSITVTSAMAGGTIFSKSGSLNSRDTASWYEYFFKEFSTRESVVFFNVPPYLDAIFLITLKANSGNAGIGACLVGNFVFIGDTQYSAVSDVVNFSTIDRDIFGNAKLEPRRNVPKTNQTVDCDKRNVNNVIKLRKALNAVPSLWYGVDDGLDGYFESLSILGIYKKFSINVDFPQKAQISLELEEI